MACLGDDLIHGKGGAQDGVIPGEAAVAAVVDTLVGYIERGKEPHGLAKVPAGDCPAMGRHGFELLTRLGREKLLKFAQQRGLAAGIESVYETHVRSLG